MDRGKAKANMLRCASGGRLVVYDWSWPTTEALLADKFIERDGPWLYITDAGRDALAREDATS